MNRWSLFALGFLWLLPALGWSQQTDPTAASLMIKNWYGAYSENPYILEIPFNEENLAEIAFRKSRLRYQIIYIPLSELARESATLRIGFFSDAKSSSEFARFLRLPSNMTKVKLAQESQYSEILAQLKSVSSQKVIIFTRESTSSAQGTAATFRIAKDLYMKKKYWEAGRLYRMLSIFGDDKSAAWAMELVGLCYEKQQLFADAIHVYEALLSQFPSTSGIHRVEQRLRALQTAAQENKPQLKSTRSENRNARRYFVRGVLGQYYRTLSRTPVDGESEQILNAVTTDFDLRGALHSGDHNLSIRTTAWALNDKIDGDKSEIRVKRAALGYTNERYDFTLNLGRLKVFDAGIFSAFDGVALEYNFNEFFSVGAAAGTPRYSNSVYNVLDYNFYSLYSNWEMSSNWQLNSYVVKQTVNGVTDREAIGMRGQYISERLTSSLHIDYDTAFSELNSALFNAQYGLTQNTRLSVNYGHQRSPFLSATNVLVRKPDLDLVAYLENKENKDSLLDDALSLTAINDYFALNISTKIGEHEEFIVEYYNSELSDIPVLSANPDEPPSEYTSYAQQAAGVRLVLQQFLSGGDIANLALRQTLNEGSQSFQLFLSEKFRLLKNTLFVNPRINYTRTQYDDNNRGEQYLLRYSLWTAYRPRRNLELNLEIGKESINTQLKQFGYASQYIFGGFRWNF